MFGVVTRGVGVARRAEVFLCTPPDGGGGMRMRRAQFSIAGLMGLVLVASIGLAALRSGSETWAGVLFLVTCGVLALAVVGVACRGAGERAWWIGFALFGWGYLALAYWCSAPTPRLPTIALLSALKGGTVPLPQPRSPNGGMGGGMVVGCFFAGAVADPPYWDVGHSLCSLLAAALGG